jgi:beta-lactamase regulating signal transducer with metallopeptidase domain
MMELIFLATALSDGAWLDAPLRAALRGSVLLLAAGAATLLLRRASAAARHLVWALAFAGLLALPVLPALLPALEVPLPPLGAELLGRFGMETPELPEVEIPFTVEVAPDPDPDPQPDPDPELAAVSDAILMAQDALHADTRGAAPHGEHAVEVHHGALALGWPLLLLVAWAAGSALMLGLLLLGVLRLRSEDARARWVMDGPLAELLERLRAEAGVLRPVALLQGPDDSAMPVTWGVLRPRILLPAGAEEWPAERLRSVLLHELAHVRRGDWAVLLAAGAACALYWFNPLVWAAAARLRAESEHACDDQVLRAGARPSDYAGHLLEVARTLRGPPAAHAAAVAMARPAQIRGRLLAVLAEERPRGPVSRRFAVPVLLAASLAVALLAALSPVAGEAAPAEGSPAARTPAEVEAVEARAVDHGRLAELDGRGGTGAPLAALDTPAAPADTPSPAAVAERCPVTGGSSRHEEVGDDGRREASWHNQRGCGGRLESAGRVSYDSGRTDVAGVAPGGRFVIELYDAGDRRRAEVVPAAGGVRRTFTVNGRAREWDAGARRWMAGALAEYFAAMKPAPAPPAPPRPGRVRAETALLPEGASSGDRAGVLEAVAVSEAWFRAVEAIPSGGDRRDLLLAVVRRPEMDPSRTRRVIRAAEDIGSSSDRAAILLALADRGLAAGPVRDDFLRAARGITSSPERERVLARVGARAAAAPAADTVVKPGATTTLHWTDTVAGRSASLEARDTEVDERGNLRVLPGGFVVVDESHGDFRQRVRVERGPDGRLRRSYTGGSVDPARRLEWEAALAARFADGRRRRW